MRPRDEKDYNWAPITAIDKALAITPLFSSIVDGQRDKNDLFEEFEKEYEKVRSYAIKHDEFSNRTQARICYLVASLITRESKQETTASEAFIFALEKMRSLSATSKDFNSYLPLENGFWGVEVAAALAKVANSDSYVASMFEKLCIVAAEAINEISVLITDKDEMLVHRTKNSVSLFIVQELMKILENNPENEAELDRCIESFKSIISSFYKILELTRQYDME